MGGRLSRLSPSVTAASHLASSSSNAATPPQFLAAQKASAVIDASRQALLDNQRVTSDAPQSITNLTRQDATVSSLGSLRLQDALGRGGGGGQEGEGGAVTPEQLRAAYSSEMNKHASRTASDNAHIAASMNKIMGGMSVKNRVVSGSSVASATRTCGVEAADVFRDILAAATVSPNTDAAQLAKAWKCDEEQARCIVDHVGAFTARTTGGSSDVFKAAVHVYAAPVRNAHSARNVSDAEANATGA